MLADPMAGISGQTRDMLASMSGGTLPTAEPDDVRALTDGLELELAGLRLTVDHAPGHTRGSVMFRRPAGEELPPILLSGDVLFEGSIGRTDLPGGSHEAMLSSLRREGAAARRRDRGPAGPRRHDDHRPRARRQPLPHGARRRAGTDPGAVR